MISTEAEEPISRRDKAGTRGFPGVRRAWLFSVVVHIVVLLIVVVLALHPGKVLAPRSQGDSSQGEGSLLRASLVSRASLTCPLNLIFDTLPCKMSATRRPEVVAANSF